MIALGAGAALIGAALLYYFSSKGGDDAPDYLRAALAVTAPEASSAEIATKIDQKNLRDVKRNERPGYLDSHYFLNVLQLVGEMTKEGLKEGHKTIVDSRREAYRQKDDESYTEIVQHQTQMEQQYSMKILEELVATLGINEQEFGQTHQAMMMNQQTQEFVMAAQQGKLTKPKPEMPKLSSKETLRHLKVTAEIQEKQILKQQESMQQMP